MPNLWNIKEIERRKVAALAKLGGVCVRCGTTERLEFDHVDPATKIAAISTMWTLSRERFWAELEKCQILCHEHHIEKTQENKEFGGGQNRINDHATEAMYLKGCRCKSCKLARHDARVRRGEIGVDLIRPYKVEHGGGKQGQRGCKCDLCHAKKASYMRDLREQQVIVQQVERRLGEPEVPGSSPGSLTEEI